MTLSLVELAQGPPSKEIWSRWFFEVSERQEKQTIADLRLAGFEVALQRWPDVLRAAVLTENEQPEEDAWMWPIDPFTSGAPWLRLVRHVVASVDEIRAVPPGSEVERLAFPAVSSLRLRHKLASFLDAAHACSRFPSVRSVDLSSVIFFPPDSPTSRAGWSEFVSVLAAIPVRELNISRVPLSLDDAARLIASPLASALESLHVSATRPPLGLEGARVLGTWPANSKLDTLSCAENGLGDAGAVALGEGALLDRIRCLDLSRNGLTDVFMRWLCDRPGGVAFGTLRLGGSRLSVMGVEMLAANTRLSDGCLLDLSECKLMDDHLDLLLSDRLVRAVAEFDLRANRLSDRSVERFLTTRFPALRVIRLEKNRVTANGAQRLEAWARQHGVTCTARPLR